MQAYSPLALQPGWVLERYLGWSCAIQEPGLKLLTKRRGLLRSHLLLTDHGSLEHLAAMITQLRLVGPLQFLWVCHFGGETPCEDLACGGQRLPPLADGRWFGTGTFVIDLTASEETLFSKISARERTKLRQVERAGLSGDATSSPARGDLAEFVALYGEMARERGLERPTTGLLERMSRDGVLLLARCRSAEGRTLAANVAFAAHGQGYFLHGVRAREAASGAGVLAQWTLMRALKAAGLRYYDLGLVASTAEDDGRYRFKRSLGGTYVPFGQEYRHVPAWQRRPHQAFQRARLRLVRQSGQGRPGDE